jgi:hypothetical protein
MAMDAKARAEELLGAIHANLTPHEFHNAEWRAVRLALLYVLHGEPEPEVIRRGRKEGL